MEAATQRRTSHQDRRITITGIRDQENETVPTPALKSLVERITRSMWELGLKASIETSD